MNSYDLVPFFQFFQEPQNILIAGCGGGFDIYGGIPLWYWLTEMGHTVHLASFSFTRFGLLDRTLAHEPAIMITAETPVDLRIVYCPEACLAQWFDRQHEHVPIYTVAQCAPQQLYHAYTDLIDAAGITTVILVDGGTDSLLAGDEAGIGTYGEDLASILAVHHLIVNQKFLCSIGFGVDAFHEVPHYDVLRAIAETIHTNGFLGSWAWTSDMPPVNQYIRAVRDANTRHSMKRSIVQNAIVSALEGRFGEQSMTNDILPERVFVNPLLTQCWCFQLDALYQRLMIDPEAIWACEDFGQVLATVDRCRETLHLRPKRSIPL